ncbi:Prolyl 4-hydroxylase subunit alpha-1 [Armadillidium vulgare]|nr:Prolyl 4-hydroxylase subunit alpha-1 [Armadillidium vulgare]
MISSTFLFFRNNINMKFHICAILFIFITQYENIKADVYTSMAHMSRLLTTEGEMIRTVENYITAQEERLQKLKNNVHEMEKVHELAAKSPETFLANPLNSYLLIKRLTIDWADLQTVLSGDDVGKAMLTNLTSMAGMLQFPDEEDLSGVAIALMRLQDTYQLDTAQLAEGKILGTQSAYRELTAGDCFELGRQSYNIGDFYHTVLWMNEALNRYERETNATADLFDILEYLAFSTYKQGNVKKALQLTNRLLDINPEHKRALGNKVFYEKAIDEETSVLRGESGSVPVDEAVKKGYTVKENSSPRQIDYYAEERPTYERLCRGESKLTPKKFRKFKCYLQHGPGSFLRIAPVKAEVMHINPTITIYHDIIYEEEMDVIKQLAIPKFKRATVQNFVTGELETASYRISKSAWLTSDESSYVANVNKRMEEITGLDLDTAEELQVANYGIGGHYEPHFDFARVSGENSNKFIREEKDAFKSLGTGNRIATFLFYMTDVEAGGATVFPRLELSLKPIKGAAAFWYNLYPNGEGDHLTRHAACPVLVGQKWVSNKWIHERGQEFRRPCALDYDAV